MGEKTKKLMETISDPEKKAAFEREYQAVRVLSERECWCGRPKRRKNGFCWPCWNRLPKDLKAALTAMVGNGFEGAYFESLAWLWPAARGTSVEGGVDVETSRRSPNDEELIERPFCEVAFDLIAELGKRLGGTPVAKHFADGCWEHRIEDQWVMVLNPRRDPQEHDGQEVLPFHCNVSFNGWPWAVFNPMGGSVGVGVVANRETFLEALTKAVEKADGQA